MAQLVERLVRNEEASGSNPLISTRNAVARTRILVREEYFALIVFYAEKEKASRS